MEILEDYTHAGLPVEAGAALIIEVDGYPAGLQPQIDRITSIIERFNAFGLRCTQDEEERAAIWLARKSVAGALARLAPASSGGGSHRTPIPVGESLASHGKNL